MRRLSDDIASMYHDLGDDDSLAKKSRRASQVRSMWAACVEPMILEHTNSVYIIKEEERKILIVYVDDSIFAAELNARRELIKLKLLQDFNEDIDEFKILISRGRYKKNFPFKNDVEPSYKDTTPSIPLNDEELFHAQQVASLIEDPILKEKLLRAMVADLEWKKGSNPH